MVHGFGLDGIHDFHHGPVVALIRQEQEFLFRDADPVLGILGPSAGACQESDRQLRGLMGLVGAHTPHELRVRFGQNGAPRSGHSDEHQQQSPHGPGRPKPGLGGWARGWSSPSTSA